MLRTAIVEDDEKAAAHLLSLIERFSAETGIAVENETFRDGVAFLSAYRSVYDLVLMDVEMPFLDGTETAKRLRALDPVVTLVFITNMPQYAIRGYAVGAVDYILKPVGYARLKALLRQIETRVRQSAGTELMIRTPSGMARVLDRDILYLTSEDHLLLYHTADGVIESWDTLAAAQKALPMGRFFRIGKSCIVNLTAIRSVDGDAIRVGSETLNVSRRYKKAFWDALNASIGR